MEVKNKIKILAMSDTHDGHENIKIEQLPEADIFIHAGDFTMNSFLGQIDRFVQFLKKLPYKHKIVIAGNHDFVFDTDEYERKLKPLRHPNEKLKSEEEIQKLKKVCTYIDHELIEVEGIKIFGSAYQPQFFDWGFQYPQSRANEIWGDLPKQIDILLTHGAPYGIMDMISNGTHIGCPTLAQKVTEIKPKIHIFGHVHYSAGETQIDGIKYYNVAIMSQGYQVSQKAKLIELQI